VYGGVDGFAVAHREAERPARRATCIGRSSITSWSRDGVVSSCLLMPRKQLMGSQAVQGCGRDRDAHCDGVYASYGRVDGSTTTWGGEGSVQVQGKLSMVTV
jgi:hypothetical protein